MSEIIITPIGRVSVIETDEAAQNTVPAKWDTMTRKQLMATATEYGSERDAAKQDTLRAFDERNVLLDQLKTATNTGLELAARACDDYGTAEARYMAAAIRALKT